MALIIGLKFDWDKNYHRIFNSTTVNASRFVFPEALAVAETWDIVS
jgi:hypothetical protein